MEYKVAIIGLGYVGLPLAVAAAEKYSVVGYDINAQRIDELNNRYDRTGEVDETVLAKRTALQFTSQGQDVASANFYIVTVPTPIDKNNNPDLSLLQSASNLIGTHLKEGDIIVYEFTVFPGCTEDECLPIL